MNIKDMKIENFIEELSSSSPTPGGGSSAALLSTIGISLNNMVCNLTIGKEKYKEKEEIVKEILKNSTILKEYLKKLIEEDVVIYKKVSKAYKMPKNTEKEKNIRKEIIEISLKEATIIPFKIMEMSLESLILVEKSLNKTNVNLVSDLGVAAISLKAGAKSAWLNVLINLKSIKDKEFVSNYRKKGEEILKEIEKKSDKIYLEILEDF